jgi:hypothetical protein
MQSRLWVQLPGHGKPDLVVRPEPRLFDWACTLAILKLQFAA